MTCEMNYLREAETPDQDETQEVKLLDRDMILNASDMDIEAVPVPEWGGTVFVKTMCGFERDALEASISGGSKGKTNLEDFRAKIAVATVCDREGNALFTRADIAALTKKSAAALDRIFTVARRLNRISEQDEQELVENLE